eukprot:1566163-Amphidinium_carterae.1
MAALSPKFVQFIMDACLSQTLKWTVNGALSDGRTCGRGIPQGCALDGQQVPVESNPNIFALACSTLKLPPPGAHPLATKSRSIGRWKKVNERLGRLARLAVGLERSERTNGQNRIAAASI